MYSLALGYNFRSILLQLAKFENRLGIKPAMLRGWPKSLSSFNKYTCYCTPPEVILVFWWSFVFSIIGVCAAAIIVEPHLSVWLIVGAVGVSCFLCATLSPLCFGWKLKRLVCKEKNAEKDGEWNPVSKV